MPTPCWLKHRCSIRAWVPISFFLSFCLSVSPSIYMCVCMCIYIYIYIYIADSLERESQLRNPGNISLFLLSRLQTTRFLSNQGPTLCLFFPWPCCLACAILVPWPGLKPSPLQWKHGVSTTGPPGWSLFLCLNKKRLLQSQTLLEYLSRSWGHYSVHDPYGQDGRYVWRRGFERTNQEKPLPWMGPVGPRLAVLHGADLKQLWQVQGPSGCPCSPPPLGLFQPEKVACKE